jgi:hypothetical protein
LHEFRGARASQLEAAVQACDVADAFEFRHKGVPVRLVRTSEGRTSCLSVFQHGDIGRWFHAPFFERAFPYRGRDALEEPVEERFVRPVPRNHRELV